jgi:hypothetical protein
MALKKDSIYTAALNRFNRLRREANLATGEAVKQNVANRTLSMRPIQEQLTDSPGNSKYYGRVVKNEAAGRGMLSSTGTQQNLTDAAKDLTQQKDTVNRGYYQANAQLATQKRQTLQGITDQQEAARLEQIRRNNAARGV